MNLCEGGWVTGCPTAMAASAWQLSWMVVVLLVLVAWGTRFEGIRSYKNSGNEYKVVAVAYGDWEPKYHVEVMRSIQMRRDDILRALARFRDLKQDEFGIVRIGVFGSVAREGDTEASDVDVVVELGQPDLLALVGIKQELEELLHRPVDVVRYRERMNAYLKRRIEQEAVYV
jgi:predicted nucleotidyltransferase